MARRSARASSLVARSEQIAGQFEVDHEQVRKLTEHFVAHMKDALTHDGPSQIPSFVTKIPDGTEKGVFLAVDLGGTNCRVCSIELHGDSTYSLVQSKHLVPLELRVNPSYQPLFRFIAEKIGDFINNRPELYHLRDVTTNKGKKSEHQSVRRYNHLKLGFTFSFTCHQESLARGSLLHWDKGWDIPSALGCDPCVMLQEAIDELTLPVCVTALANDSVGTLMARSYTSLGRSSTLMGAIFGTGTNAAYVERLSNIRRLHNRGQFQNCSHKDLMVINTEWGCFDDDMAVLPTTIYDDLLDMNSKDQGKQMMEKRVSGLYLGELFRLILIQLLNEDLFDMTMGPSSPLFTQEGVPSSLLSVLAEDDSGSLENARQGAAISLKALNMSLDDTRVLRTIASAISQRSARLSGAAIAAIIVQSGRMQGFGAEFSSELKSVKVAAQEQQLKSSTRRNSSNYSHFSARSRLLIRRLLKFLGFQRSSRTIITSNSSPSLLLSEKSANTKEDIIDIGVDGSLVEFHPTFQTEIRATLREIFGEGGDLIRIGIAKDGSSVGAALMAQSAST
ncbi:putative glucokinase [Whalleya microplaca]|nr:putative glucokinase [Whalleya microplaca]